jgi:SpoVK/Ycf46/Vps4 family AAA+-type ATPase
LLANKLEAEGDHKSALAVRRTLSQGKALGLQPARVSPAIPVDGESRFALADERTYEVGEVRVVLDEATQARVTEFIRHVHGADRLLASGMGIAPSLLVYGPPGCGKSELAKFIAAQLGMPILTARTDTLISSFLGSTAKNLRLLFEHAMGRPCVLFLDEFDAVAKLRDDQHELGELKRVVVSLLQNIDALDNKTVLVAATNHDHLLDRAIWRRFAFRINLGLPAIESRAALLKEFLGEHAPKGLDIGQLAIGTEGMTGSDLRQVCEEARRSAILDCTSEISDNDFLLRLARIRIPEFDAQPLSKRLASVRALNSKLYTVRRMSDMFDVSTGKISTLLRMKEGE